MHAPRGTRRSHLSGAPRYLPSVVIIKSRSRHANRPTFMMWYETPDCSLVDKRPVREVISICWRAPCDKTKYGFIMPGMLMSDQRWRSCCTLADGKHNNNTSNKKTGLKNSSRNANTNANTLIIGHSYASPFYRRNMDIYIFLFFLTWYVGNAFEWSTLRLCCTLSDGKHNNIKTSHKRQELNIKCEYVPGHEMSRGPRYDEATYYRRREPRLDGFFF